MKKYLNAQLVSLFSHMQDWVQPRVMWFSRGVQVGKNFYEKVPLTIIVLKYSSLLSFFVIPYNSIERKSLSACITRLCRKSYDGTYCVQMQCWHKCVYRPSLLPKFSNCSPRFSPQILQISVNELEVYNQTCGWVFS